MVVNVNFLKKILIQCSENCQRLQGEKRILEEELNEFRNKQSAVAQWEAQITEIIQWWATSAI